jgi:hypothetical protein
MAGEFGVSTAWPAGHAVMVRRLVDVADRALAIQDEADAAVRACGIRGVVSSEVALRLGAMLRLYSRLYYEVEGLETELNPEFGAVRRDLLELLSYHLHMLRDAGDLVFSARRVPRNERFRLELAEGLGPRAEDLARLRERLFWAQFD